MENILTVSEANDALDKLRIIYGENISIIANKIIVVNDEDKHNDSDDKDVSKYGMTLMQANIPKKQSGLRVYTIDGNRLFTEKLGYAVPVIDKNPIREVGCAIMSDNEVSEYFGDSKIGNIRIIDTELTINKSKLQSIKGTYHRAELILVYNFKRYIGKFNEDGRLRYFIATK